MGWEQLSQHRGVMVVGFVHLSPERWMRRYFWQRWPGQSNTDKSQALSRQFCRRTSKGRHPSWLSFIHQAECSGSLYTVVYCILYLLLSPMS